MIPCFSKFSKDAVHVLLLMMVRACECHIGDKLLGWQGTDWKQCRLKLQLFLLLTGGRLKKYVRHTFVLVMKGDIVSWRKAVGPFNITRC